MADFDDPEVDIIPSKNTRNARVPGAFSRRFERPDSKDFSENVTFLHQFLALVS